MTTLTTPTEAAVQICHAAADIIEARGWTPYAEIHEESGRVSLIGALRLAARPDYERWAIPWTSDLPEYDEARYLLDRALGGMSPRLWSVMPGRKQAEVVALLRGVGA